MESKASARQGRGLSQQDFERFLARLDANIDTASVRYARVRNRLVRYCRRHNEALRAEELADRALDEVAKKTDLAEIRDIERFAIGILRMLLMAHKRRNRESLSDELETVAQEIQVENAIVDRLDLEKKQRCFLDCIKALHPSERNLILQYFPNENRADLRQHRKELAETLGVEGGALATRVSRLRRQLIECCLACYRRGGFNK